MPTGFPPVLNRRVRLGQSNRGDLRQIGRDTRFFLDVIWQKSQRILRRLRIQIVVPFDASITQDVDSVVKGHVFLQLNISEISKMHQPPAESIEVRERQHLEHDYVTIGQSGYRYALSMLRHEGDAEEAVQEAFCRLQNQAHQLYGSFEAALLDWNVEENRATFFATLRNHCIDLIRKRSVRKEIQLLDQDRSIKTNRIHHDAAEMVAAVDLLINQLPENWADVLKLKVNADLSYDEISEIVGCTRNQVRTWIYRARRQLVHELARQGYTLMGR